VGGKAGCQERRLPFGLMRGEAQGGLESLSHNREQLEAHSPSTVQVAFSRFGHLPDLAGRAAQEADGDRGHPSGV